MTIFKTAVGSDDGTVYTCDTIEHEGQLWLVPIWTEPPAPEKTKPARIILLDSLPHQTLDKMFGPHHIVLNVPIPKAVLDGRTPPEQAHGFVVKDWPDITIEGRGENLH